MKLTRPMLHELRAIARDGEPSMDWLHAPDGLWFHARDKVIGALLRRGLIVDDPNGYTITDAGRAALANPDPEGG